jgi:hypothetical protein
LRRPGSAEQAVVAARRFLLGLGAASAVVTAVELVMIRHWDNATQLVPWPGIAALFIAAIVAARRQDGLWKRAAAVLLIGVVAIALAGVVEHVVANYDAAPLDFRYSSRWASMSATSKWWAAATESVGPSPVLAPLVLLEGALCVGVAMFLPTERPR